MQTQLLHLLNHWHSARDTHEWVVGVVYKTEGSCYRRAGAMMLFNSLGQQFGMLSGGCLESDILRRARFSMMTGKAITLVYDGSDDGDLSFQLGIGCGGTVHILLQPINSGNHYLSLDKVREALTHRQSGVYRQLISSDSIEAHFAQQDSKADNPSTELIENASGLWLITPINPLPHLLVVGGGMDAQPVVAMAAQLGWEVSLWDPRPANGRREYFPLAKNVLNDPVDSLTHYAINESVDAAILMSHSLSIDSSSLRALNDSRLKYLALLGPTHRKDQVLDLAELTEDQLSIPLASPAGLDLGDEYPESIAISILAECHASLNNKTAVSLSRVLKET